MDNKKTILIADNSDINRMILKANLSDEYEILEARDGQEALDVLRAKADEVSVLLLDLLMPVKDGHQVIAQMKQTHALADIPIIVITAENVSETEIRALTEGAVDFITKPFEPEITKTRIHSVIEAREVEELRIQSRVFQERAYLADYDELTGIFSRSAFLRDTKEMLTQDSSADYTLVMWDIDKFRLLNGLFGTKTGDRVLQVLGKRVAEHGDALEGTYGRYGADSFVLCALASELDPRKLTAQLVDEVRADMIDVEIGKAFVIAAGVYPIDDHSMETATMCDRAVLALQPVKGNYDRHIGYYDKKLRARLDEEQDILENMEAALEKGEFTIRLQPIYNVSTGAPASAEALVRWERPGKGTVSPDTFIGLFEKNGFISQLDYTVWEQVCQVLAERHEMGLAEIPISVNLSRRSAYNPDLYDIIVELVERYHIDPHLFRIEITESSYIDDSGRLIEMVKRLQEYGFTVLMDDFGSGYSSLNALKDIPVDILKVDMMFMQGYEEVERTGTIVASILRMTKWLGIPVIAEGVETVAQYEFLRSVGCEYTQGFYFARPMTRADFERQMLVKPPEPVDEGLSLSTKDVDDLLGGNHVLDRIFDDVFDGCCVYEWNEDNCVLELIRISEGFRSIFGYDKKTLQEQSKNVLTRMSDVDRERTIESLKVTSNAHKPVKLELTGVDVTGKQFAVRFTFDSIGNSGVKTYLVFAAIKLI